jgi:isochorismate synthase
MGPINHQNQNALNTCYWGVNIRCMQVVDDCALLYVGGGITADSDPELEWEETVKKSQILTTVFD